MTQRMASSDSLSSGDLLVLLQPQVVEELVPGVPGVPGVLQAAVLTAVRERDSTTAYSQFIDPPRLGADRAGPGRALAQY